LPNDHIFNTNISSLPASTGGATFKVSAALRSGGVVTLTIIGGLAAAENTPVTVSGVTDSSFNGTFDVLAYDGNNAHLRYNQALSNASSIGGNVFVPYTSGMGTLTLNYLPSFPINYANSSTPTDNMVFYYTPLNNGTYQSPQWPNANIEGDGLTQGLPMGTSIIT